MYHANGSILAATGVSAGLATVFFGGLGLVVVVLACFAIFSIYKAVKAR